MYHMQKYNHLNHR